MAYDPRTTATDPPQQMVPPSSIPTPPAHSHPPVNKKITLTIPSSFRASSPRTPATGQPAPPQQPPPSTQHPLSSSGSPAKHNQLQSYPSPPIGDGEVINSELLERELPDVSSTDLVPLAEVVDAVIREIYLRLGELGEVLPSLHESARAPLILQFSLYAKRQVVRLLALVRWSKESDVVTKCMNINAFLSRQNAQFEEAVAELTAVRAGLDGTRLRNPDLLTALDVLTTGTYQRLPQRFQTDFLPPSPLTDASILGALLDLNTVLSYRLRVKEVVPVQMRSYRIADGRVYFTCPGLFEASLSLTGAQKAEEEDTADEKAEKVVQGKLGGAWYLVDLSFRFHIGGGKDPVDDDLRKDFPTVPPKATFDEIAHVSRLQLTAPPSASSPPPTPATGAAASIPERPFDPLASHMAASPFDGDSKFKFSLDGGEQAIQDEVVAAKEIVHDAPLVRVYNLLQSLSLTYQLEILFRQAQQIKSLGWADCFSLEMNKDRKLFKISYWPRQRPLPRQSNQPSNSSASAPPATYIAIGGTLTVALVDRTTAPSSSSRTNLSRILNEVENAVKTKGAPFDPAGGGEPAPSRVSDRVLEQELSVVWEADRKWTMGLDLSDGIELRKEFTVDATNLDLEAILLGMVQRHANALVRSLHRRLLAFPSVSVIFDLPAGDIVLEEKLDEPSRLLIRIHGDQFVTVSMDSRSGRISVRDSGDILPTEDARLVQTAKAINENPAALNELLLRLRLSTINDDLDQKFNYLGLTTLRRLSLKPNEYQKFGPTARAWLFVPIPDSLSHYFVAVMTQGTYRFALVTARSFVENGLRWVTFDQIGWLNENTLLRGSSSARSSQAGMDAGGVLGKRKFDGEPASSGRRAEGKRKNRFYVDVEDLRELYSYCVARVASVKVEQQLKARLIPYELVSSDRKGKGRALSSSSPMESSIPTISVQARDLLKSVPAAVDVALPNISMRVRNWWGEGKCQVVTSIKLRQQLTLSLAGRKHEMASSSRNVLIDTATSVVSFVTENIEGCVDALTEEFSRVGKLAVIASEINRSTDPNLKMTYFDLQTATFIYAPGLLVSIGWRSAPLESASPGDYDVTFAVVPPADADLANAPTVNPHLAMAGLFRDRLNESDEAGSLLDFIQLLRTTLPLLQEANSALLPPPPQPAVTVRLWPKSVSCFCFVYENGITRFGLTYNLILSSSDRLPRYLIQDASQPPPPSSRRRARFRPIAAFHDTLTKLVTDVAAEYKADGKKTQKGRTMPPVMVLGEEEGVVCDVDVVRSVMGKLHREVMARF